MHLSHITKRFGAFTAVDGVSLDVRSGEIVALVGENGAGKTTLMRIAAGELPPDAGSVELTGRAELVHQHFMLVPDFTIAENLALASPHPFRFARRRTLQRAAESLIASTGIELRDVSRRASDLAVGEKSKLELIKSIARQPATLILDEPTSVLTPNESEELFGVMRRLAESGTSIVFVSHKLPEVLAVAERIVVMRGGRVVAETLARDTTAADLARAMVDVATPRERTATRSDAAPVPHDVVLEYENLQLRRGEIVAIVGVAGNGQNDLALNLRRTLDRGRSGHIPEDRTRDGIVAEMTIAENLALRQHRWRASAAARHAAAIIERFDIRARGPLHRAGELSGGNQQKVVLARELDTKPEVIVAAEPTRGLDIEATAFVHNELREAVSDGAAALLITSDLDEAFDLADAIHVIYRGRLSERLSMADAQNRVASLMAGIE